MIAIKFTASGHFTGPIHLTATERPKLTDLGGPTKPNQSSWWNLPRITLRTCHWLCPNSPYMWPTRMRRTRVWSSLTSVPRSISLSRHWPLLKSRLFPSIPILRLSDFDLIICSQDCLVESNRNWKACQARKLSMLSWLTCAWFASPSWTGFRGQ